MYPAKRKKIKARKKIAVFLLLVLLNQILSPGIAYALTAGPTAPEATNFEPVDTTDMVSPLTGGLTYTMPLLEVPGPEGSYPLALAYHAGVQPNEEASWVGLGWSLNPGAITRNVNGFADDYSDVNQIRRDYWEGGSRSTFGITVGTPVGVSFGLSFSQDTYRGFGVGTSISFSPLAVLHDLGVIGANKTGIGVSAVIGTDPYGGLYGGMNANTGIGGSIGSGLAGLAYSANIGISTNFKSISFNGGVDLSVTVGNYLGASIGSGSSKVNLSVAGGGYSSSVSNVNAGKIQTESSGSGLAVPLPGGFSLSLSYNYTRYWSDETADILTNGSLYIPQELTDQTYFATRTYDIYRLPDQKNTNIVDNPDPVKAQGGTFPAFDDYSITAQGLSGSMRPYIYQSMLYSQNQTDIVERTGVIDPDLQLTPGVQFRFVNDFSNSYRQGHANNDGLHLFDNNPVYGNNDGDAGYNKNTNHLAGSKHIDWYTNSDINGGSAKAGGFIDTRSAGFARMGSNDAGQLTNTKGYLQIGGFTITNASGVSYHYALPAYAFNEYSYTGKINDSQYTQEWKNEPYAYTWYLTAVTGPDYVDTNNNGLVDDQDWGYWVSYEYGKWTSSYNWRNPFDGAHVDVDPNYKSYSTGTKEVYYLNAIKTRTHTALFVKEFRADGKTVPATGALRLNNILILQNDQFSSSINAIETASTKYNVGNGDGRLDHNGNLVITQFGSNMIDVDDIAQLSENLNQKCLRKIQFNYDYSLCPGTVNSYDAAGTIYTNPLGAADLTKLGKLTLLSVDCQGKGGASVTPPIHFQYDLDPNDPANVDYAQVTSYNSGDKFAYIQFGMYTSTPSKMHLGDIVKLNNGTYAALVANAGGVNTFKVVLLVDNPGPTTLSGVGIATKTKNPPYVKDAYDVWGLFKSDYIPVANNENLSRLTTKVSNMATDVWSLRKIKTNLGSDININYEGNTYSKSVLNKNKSMIVNSASIDSTANTMALTVSNPLGVNLAELYRVGDKFDATMLFNRTIHIVYHGANGNMYDKKVIGLGDYPPAHVYNVVGNVITINVNPALFSALNNAAAAIIYQPGGTTISSVSATLSTANIKASAPSLNYGGGIRVKDIIVDDLSGHVNKTSYNYNIPDFSTNPRVSSGVTSYEPVGLDIDNLANYLNSTVTAEADLIKQYRKDLYKDLNYLLTVAREAPAPGVMYEYVTIADSTILNGKSLPNEGLITYQFRVFNTGMLGIKQYQYDVTSTASLKNMAVKDYTSQVGNLIRTIKYDSGGNKLSESVNHFLNDDIVDQSFDQQVNTYEPRLAAYNYQGVIQERYGDPRSFSQSGNWIAKITMSARDKFPVIPTGTTLIDYKNGTKIDQQSLAFDYYSGNVTKTLTVDAFGNRFVNTVVPAYHIYANMGVKVYDVAYTAETSRHRNMLTQEAENYTYKVDNNNNPIGIITASAQTWGTDVPVLDPDGNLTTTGQTNIWRTKANYSWMPAGSAANNITPVASFAGYFSGGSSNPSWKKTSQINLYNVYSNALEASDINNQYAATRMGYKNSRVVITGSLAKYDEIAYAGAEDDPLSNGNFSTNISAGAGSINTDTTFTHTGTKSLKVSSGQQGFNYAVNHDKLSAAARDYNVAVWVKPSSGTVANAALYYQAGGGTVVTPAQSYSKTAAGWYLLEMRVPAAALPASGNLTVGCKNTGGNDLYFDDFRFQPSTSAATAYVYDRRTGEPTHIIGNNNLFIRYQYDAAGRLVRTYREVLGKTQVPLAAVNKYHYALSGGVSTNEFHPSVTVNVVSPGANTTIGFSANDGGASTPTTYYWTFGDGTSSTQANGTHAYSTPGTYNVSVVINNPTYGSQTITRQVTVALITLAMNSFDNYVIANVSGIDLTTCQAFWVEKYCDYQPGIDEPCNLDFLPWQYTEVTDHGANPLFEWGYFGEVTPSFVSLHKFYFLVTDGRGHQYQSAVFQ